MAERRPIPNAPGYFMDQIGEVYRKAGGNIHRIASDPSGLMKLHSGNSCQVIHRRELLKIVWPDEIPNEPLMAVLDSIQPETAPKASEEAVEAPPKEKPRRRRRRKTES